ncbi:ead/Ea22-like family protein [Salmonella enterica]|nr:ead/Ea22-like family protein [Salmonella enterica]
MSNIDKQVLREAAERAIHDDWGYDTDIFHEQVTPSVVLALLDENLQLQREKDAIEAVALALRDDMRQAREVTLPPTFWYEHDDLSRDVPVLDKRLVKKAIRAAGIGVKGE